jgi:hypothetical protein
LYKSLVGDTSDNIPGVNGMGEKNVVKLFEFVSKPERKTLNDIYQVCENPPKKSVLYERILNVRKQVEIFYKIMNIMEPNISEETAREIVEKYKSKTPPLKKYDFYYAWASDLNEVTGEGRLARLFLYNFAKNNNTKIIVISKNNKYLFYNNRLKVFNKKKKNTKLISSSFFWGIFFSWLFFFKKKKFIYINYLPVWNFLIILLLAPHSIIGPITGSKIFSNTQNIRKLLFPTFYKLNLFFLYIRFKKIIFATDNLRKYVKLKYIQKCSFNFCLLYLKYLKPQYSYDKTIDIIIYNKTQAFFKFIIKLLCIDYVTSP